MPTFLKSFPPEAELARLDGATRREIQEAITIAAMARHLTTPVEGLQLDERTVRRDVDPMTARSAPRWRLSPRGPAAAPPELIAGWGAAAGRAGVAG